MNGQTVPRWESGEGWVRAICEPDGYCAGGHRCGKLDLGLIRDELAGSGVTVGDAEIERVWAYVIAHDAPVATVGRILKWGCPTESDAYSPQTGSSPGGDGTMNAETGP